MSGINKIFLVGCIKDPPELQIREGNVAYTSFKLGTTENIRKGHIITEHTEWHQIVMWRQQAESAVRLLKSDMLIYI